MGWWQGGFIMKVTSEWRPESSEGAHTSHTGERTFQADRSAKAPRWERARMFGEQKDQWQVRSEGKHSLDTDVLIWFLGFLHSFKVFPALSAVNSPGRTVEVSLLSSYLWIQDYLWIKVYRHANAEATMLFRVQLLLWSLRRSMLRHLFNKYCLFLSTILPFPH